MPGFQGKQLRMSSPHTGLQSFPESSLWRNACREELELERELSVWLGAAQHPQQSARSDTVDNCMLSLYEGAALFLEM